MGRRRESSLGRGGDAPNPGHTPVRVVGDMTPASPLEVVETVYATHRERDTPGLLDLLAEEIEWHTAEGHPYAGEGPWRGHQQVVEHVVDPINHDWDNYVTDVEQIIEGGDEIVVTARYRGTYKATGRALDAAVCVIYTVRNGLIVQFRQYTDTAQFRRVMGVDHVDD